jgi:hypothetical protein
MFYLSDKNEKEGRQCAKIVNYDGDEKYVTYTEKLDKDKEYFNFLSSDDIIMNYYFNPINQPHRVNISIFGGNGVGKSRWLAQYIKQSFYDAYTTKYKIYLITEKANETAFNGITMEKIAIPEISKNDKLQDFNYYADSLVIFDDIDAIMDKKQRHCIFGLRDSILKNARSIKVSIISTLHDMTGDDSKSMIKESNTVVFFIPRHNIKPMRYFLNTTIGLNANEINYLKSNKQSTWSAYIKTNYDEKHGGKGTDLILQQNRIFAVETLSTYVNKFTR